MTRSPTISRELARDYQSEGLKTGKARWLNLYLSQESFRCFSGRFC